MSSIENTPTIKGKPAKRAEIIPIRSPQTLSDSLEAFSMPQIYTSVSQTSVSMSSKTILSPSGDELSKSATKNIAINYGQAIISFALSKLAVPYLQPHCDKEDLRISDFDAFVRQSRKMVGGISGFRALLMVNDGVDDEKTIKFKKLFQVISEIFIKYFSVNWITHGRMTHKLVYLKFRSKMLRRVRNPEHFSYIRKREKPKRRNRNENIQEDIIKNEHCKIKYEDCHAKCEAFGVKYKHEDFNVKYEDVIIKFEDFYVKYEEVPSESLEFNVKSEERSNCLNIKSEEMNLKYEDLNMKYETL